MSMSTFWEMWYNLEKWMKQSVDLISANKSTARLEIQSISHLNQKYHRSSLKINPPLKHYPSYVEYLNLIC